MKGLGDAGETTNLQPIDVLATFIKAEDIDKMKPLCDRWAKEKAKAWPLTRDVKAGSRKGLPAEEGAYG